MRSRHVVAVAALILFALDPGCSSVSTRRGLAQACKLNSECNAGLVCSTGLCHAACAETRDCDPGALCVRSNGSTICQLPDKIGCASDADCIDELVCGNDGKCRNACKTASVCVTPQVCTTGGFCAEPTELPPGSNDLPDAPGKDAGGSPGGRAGTGGVTASGGMSSAGGAVTSGGTSSTGGVSSTGGTSSGGVPGSGGSGNGGAVGSGGAPGSGGGSQDSGASVTLTINNSMNWCNVREEGGAPFTTQRQFVVPKGTVIHLAGGPSNAVFVWGYWTGTDQVVSGKDTHATTTVTMVADETVVACCPFSNDPTTPCP